MLYYTSCITLSFNPYQQILSYQCCILMINLHITINLLLGTSGILFSISQNQESSSPKFQHVYKPECTDEWSEKRSNQISQCKSQFCRHTYSFFLVILYPYPFFLADDQWKLIKFDILILSVLFLFQISSIILITNCDFLFYNYCILIINLQIAINLILVIKQYHGIHFSFFN